MAHTDFSDNKTPCENLSSKWRLKSLFKSCSAYSVSTLKKGINFFSYAIQRAIPFVKSCETEAIILYDGAVHAREVSDEDSLAIKRDVANLCTETGLSVLEGVEFEITALVAATQAAEKISSRDQKPMTRTEWNKVALETLESVCSSPVSAAHAGIDLIHDLERTGQKYIDRKAQTPAP